MPVLKLLFGQISRRAIKICVAFLAGVVLSSAQIPASREYQIKAAFLYNFTQFVEWPAASFENGTAPLVIGVLGEDPFGSVLQETVKGEKVNGHPLTVQHYDVPKEIGQCHILFVNVGGEAQLKETLTLVKGRHVLTVSDAPDFIKRGGLVRFIKENNKIRFQINQEAAKENDIAISSKLLRLAEIVKTN
jgi:hypothetical protein